MDLIFSCEGISWLSTVLYTDNSFIKSTILKKFRAEPEDNISLCLLNTKQCSTSINSTVYHVPTLQASNSYSEVLSVSIRVGFTVDKNGRILNFRGKKRPSRRADKLVAIYELNV
jgi:hypothetical protein